MYLCRSLYFKQIELTKLRFNDCDNTVDEEEDDDDGDDQGCAEN